LPSRKDEFGKCNLFLVSAKMTLEGKDENVFFLLF